MMKVGDRVLALLPVPHHRWVPGTVGSLTDETVTITYGATPFLVHRTCVRLSSCITQMKARAVTHWSLVRLDPTNLTMDMLRQWLDDNPRDYVNAFLGGNRLVSILWTLIKRGSDAQLAFALEHPKTDLGLPIIFGGSLSVADFLISCHRYGPASGQLRRAVANGAVLSRRNVQTLLQRKQFAQLCTIVGQGPGESVHRFRLARPGHPQWGARGHWMGTWTSLVEEIMPEVGDWTCSNRFLVAAVDATDPPAHLLRLLMARSRHLVAPLCAWIGGPTARAAILRHGQGLVKASSAKKRKRETYAGVWKACDRRCNHVLCRRRCLMWRASWQRILRRMGQAHRWRTAAQTLLGRYHLSQARVAFAPGGHGAMAAADEFNALAAGAPATAPPRKERDYPYTFRFIQGRIVSQGERGSQGQA